jgi:hypothetical protein
MTPNEAIKALTDPQLRTYLDRLPAGPYEVRSCLSQVRRMLSPQENRQTQLCGALVVEQARRNLDADAAYAHTQTQNRVRQMRLTYPVIG